MESCLVILSVFQGKKMKENFFFKYKFSRYFSETNLNPI